MDVSILAGGAARRQNRHGEFGDRRHRRFGEADQFVLAGVRKALGDGIVIAGEKHPIQIICKDSQSNPNCAAEVTAQLINNDNVDLVVGSSTSDTVIPVSDQCELAGVPCITSDDPWQIWFFDRKGTLKRGSNGPIISSGALINSATYSRTCGWRCPPTKCLARCGATTATA